MATLVTQTVKISVFDVIENFYYALIQEDYEECALIKKEFYEKYDLLSEPIKKQVDLLVYSYLVQNDMDLENDMNNFFDGLLTQK